MTIINSTIKGKTPVIESLNVTPSTSAQQITAPTGTDGYSPVNVSAVTSSIDANIVAGNIKKDVTILGVTGSFEGGITPTGTKQITANGVYNVTNYASADVQVPTTAPAHYIEKAVDANGKLIGGSTIIDFTGVTDVVDYVLYYAYYQNTSISGTVDMSDLTTVTGSNACQNMFYGCTGLTSIDLSGLTTVSGQYACSTMFYGCTGITSVDLSSLTTVSGMQGCQNMFYSCTGLTSVDLSSLISVTNRDGCSSMFRGCTSLTSVDLSSLTAVSSNNGCQYMFYECTNLASINLSKLAKLGTSNNISQMFRNCTSLTELRFSGLPYTATNINSAFTNTLQGVTGCTVHFPSDWATAMASYSNITNGLGGTNTTVLFDLPAVTTLDLSYITHLYDDSVLIGFAQNNAFPNITSVNLSSLEEVSGSNALRNAFSGCTNLTGAMNLSSLKKIGNPNSDYSCNYAFGGCTGLTSVDLSSLEKIDGSSFSGASAFQMFMNCTGITSVDMSSLVTLSGMAGVNQMFKGCTSLSNIYFSSLRDIPTNMQFTLQDTAVTTISFPALKTVGYDIVLDQLFGNSINGKTYHFPSNMNGLIRISGTNTVLYDLPATNILTGANSVEYERNPKYDTSTALAWRVKDVDDVIDWTPYYTSGLTDPTVGTTIYSDSACTTDVTTVDSIS